MIGKKLVMVIVCGLIGSQALAMKRHAKAEAAFNRSPKKQKIDLPEIVERDDLYRFWMEVEFCGADLDRVDKFGYPPIMNIMCDTKKDDVRKNQYLDLLIKNGVDLNAQTPNTGFTPLHFAVSEANVQWVEKFAVAGANPNVEDCDGCTPLHHLSNRQGVDQIGIAQLLADKTDLTIRNEDGNTVLHNPDLTKATVKFLVRKNPHLVDIANDDEETPYQFLRNSGKKIKSIKPEIAREKFIKSVIIPEMKPEKRDDLLPSMKPSVVKSILNRQLTGKQMSYF